MSDSVISLAKEEYLYSIIAKFIDGKEEAR